MRCPATSIRKCSAKWPTDASDLAGWVYGDTLIADGGELLGELG